MCYSSTFVIYILIPKSQYWVVTPHTHSWLLRKTAITSSSSRRSKHPYTNDDAHFTKNYITRFAYRRPKNICISNIY